MNNLYSNKLFKYILLIFVICSQIGIQNVKCEPKRVRFNQISINENRNGFTVIKNNDDYNPNQRILIGVIVKNHEYALPTFLASLETLKCPNYMNKCDLW